jgi:hypothetical protein
VNERVNRRFPGCLRGVATAMLVSTSAAVKGASGR